MITLVVVNYRSGALAAAAIASARASSTEAIEVIVVDNSAGEGRETDLTKVADHVIEPDRNLGYGAAINVAVKQITTDSFVVANPDVSFASGSLDLLVREIGTGAAVAGPALFWDRDFQWHLPPADTHTAVEKLDEVAATRSRAWREFRDRRRTQERIAFWKSGAVREVKALSGAVLAFDREAYEREGGFDERFFLYFEETDLLRRIRLAGGRVRHVPGARVRHMFNQSARVTPGASSHFTNSERLYQKKWHSAWIAAAERRARPLPPRAFRRANGLVVDRSVVVEVSPLPWFDTAAGAFVQRGTVVLPEDVRESVEGTTIYMRSVDPATGEVLDAVECLPAP